MTTRLIKDHSTHHLILDAKLTDTFSLLVISTIRFVAGELLFHVFHIKIIENQFLKGLHRNVWHVPHCTEFDINRGKECAEILCGNHDFIAFRGAFRGNERGKQQDTHCTIFNISLLEEERDGKDSLGLCKTYYIDITGDRFLYKQVRFMVGTIVQCAMKVVTKEDLKEILNTKRWIKNTSYGQPFPRFCAPAHGLCLSSVDFEKDWEFNWLVETETDTEITRER